MLSVMVKYKISLQSITQFAWFIWEVSDLRGNGEKKIKLWTAISKMED